MAHVHTSDPVIRPIIEAVGPITLRPARDRFAVLVRSIISQQISTRGSPDDPCSAGSDFAARGIVAGESGTAERGQDSRGRHIEAEGVLSYRPGPQGRRRHRAAWTASAGLRTRKSLPSLRRSRASAVGRLKCSLIFSLGRLDVLPVDDLGVRAALKRLARAKRTARQETMPRACRAMAALTRRSARGTAGGVWM